MCFLNRHVVEVMRSNLQAQTATCVMNSFGISVNTWTKLRDGKPIRRSVAERLIGRLGRVGGYLPARQYADRGVASFNRDPVGRFAYYGEHNLVFSRYGAKRWARWWKVPDKTHGLRQCVDAAGLSGLKHISVTWN